MRASHLYNYVDPAGTLPEDKEDLLKQVHKSLAEDPAVEKELTYKNFGIF